ncbi:MAG: hypothetical protein AB8G26_12050 [Ilumatobacter sp.]
MLVIPVGAISNADGEPLPLRELMRWLPAIRSYPAQPEAASPSVSLVVDRFAYDFHVSDIGHATDVHDGDDFVASARDGVEVYVVDGVDPRRSKLDALREAAQVGNLLGAVVASFEVDHLSE